MNDWNLDQLHEECGVFGVYHQEEAAPLCYFGLHALQHRGQEAAGIAVSDGENLRCHKGTGLVTEVFTPENLQSLTGINGIGHVRYATAGGSEIENAQPILARAKVGSIAVVHNGQIVNAEELRQELEDRGSIFRGSSDSEIILHLIQGQKGTLLEKIQRACQRLEGAFAFLILTEKNLYAIRDRHGLRPLALAKLGDGYCLSSETCAFHTISAQYIRDIHPGEILKISAHGLESSYYTQPAQRRVCAMEYIYFARPDSDIDGLNVHTVRKRTGALLAQKDAGKLEADIVVGVPDSSLAAAMGYSEASGLPYETGLIKNRYVGRTFIKPTQKQRDMGVKMKLSPNIAVVRGKRVVLVDDSIVRGTTSKRIVRLLKDAGALEVHLRIAAPPILYPCFYGVDTPTRRELISARLDEEALCQEVGADSLVFLTKEELCRAWGGSDFCFACFDGDYATDLYSHDPEQ